MQLPVLPIFPEGSLASSVITCVWVGVLVVTFFNLRLGWVLSGLVVPGYLVPLLMIKPWSAGVVVIEGIATYAVVWTFSELASRAGYWSALFGRDRFFALVLASVAVRLLFDGWWLPLLGETLNARYGLALDYRHNLHSFGLIVIALIANQFWKPGLIKGLFTLVVTVALTFVLVRYVLMELTNFGIGSLRYLYEDLASSILASPKAYIILLSAAFLASRMNLHYGWEYNGILIPSLLALQWYQPSKILTSFIEAFLILAIARGLLRTPLFKGANIEGARKLLLFFNIGFAYKLLLGYAVLRLWPQVKVTDTYAFGYLVSTLMAVRMHDKDIAAGLTRTTLQTSLVSVVLATAIGYSLTLFSQVRPLSPGASATAHAGLEQVSGRPLVDLLRARQVGLYRPRGGEGVPQPLPEEVESFTRALRLLLDHPEDAGGRRQKAAELLAGLGYRLSLLDGQRLYLDEREPARGWGIYVLDPDARSSLVVEVPAPIEERGTLEAGAWLYTVMTGRGLAIAGARRTANPDRSADVLLSPATLYQAFHRTLAAADVLQVRGYTPSSARRLAGVRDLPGATAPPETTLWVHASLPPGLDLARLQALVPDFRVHWSDTPLDNLQRASTARGFAELYLNRPHVRSLLANVAQYLGGRVPLQVGAQRIDGYLQEWLLGGKPRIAAAGSDAYRPPRLEELVYLDENVLTPLLAVVRASAADGRLPPGQGQELDAIAASAGSLGYGLVRYRHHRTGREYLILEEREDVRPRRYWGTYVFRLGPADGYLVQVPRPLFEINSFEYAVALFERLRGRALLIAGADPRANRDGSADLVRMENLGSLFSLAGQVTLREAGPRPMLVVHSRAFGVRPDTPLPEADVLVAFGDGAFLPEQLDPLESGLLASLHDDGLSHRLVDGSLETAGYEVGGLPQSLYPAALPDKDFAILWLSPLARASFRQQDENRPQARQLAALGVTTLDTDLADYLHGRRPLTATATLPEGLRAALHAYLDSGDAVTLRRVLRTWPGYPLRRLIDRDSRQAFLLVEGPHGRPGMVMNLAPHRHAASEVADPGDPDIETLRRFVARRGAWLVFRGEP